MVVAMGVTKCYRCDMPAKYQMGVADPDMPQYPYCFYHMMVMKEWSVLVMFPAMLDSYSKEQIMGLAESGATKRINDIWWVYTYLTVWLAL